MTFEEIGLSPELMNGLRDVNYQEPTEIQQSVIPLALEGKDVLVKDDEDKGKYGSFVIPLLEKVTRDKDKQGTRILILTPHDDDARQIDELIWAMGYHAEVECATVGMEGDWDEQMEVVQNGIQVLIANPGRFLEILQENRFVFRDVELLVLDNIDDIISLGLVDKISDIQKRIIGEYQILGYASEFSDEVKSLANNLMKEPEVIGFENVRSNGQMMTEPPKLTDNLKQGYIKVPNRMKISTLMAHIDATPTDTCVIFTASKRGTDRLYRVLRKRNFSATSLHGKLSDEKHAQRFANFANGDVQFLLVANISAADLDLRGVKQVINYDVPNDADEYRYRAGLVSEGKAGRIVSLVSKQDRSDIRELSNELGEAPEELPLPGEVKKKLKERKNKNRGRNRNKSKKKRGSHNHGESRKRQKKKELELPRPSYDKLSGGRAGNKGEEEGVIGFFKKLFS